MLSLETSEYHHVLPLMKDMTFKPVFAYGVLTIQQPGIVFVDEFPHPSCGFIMSRGGKYLLIGSTSNTAFLTQIVVYLSDSRNHSHYYDLYTSSEELLTYISTKLAGQVVQLYRYSLQLDHDKFRLIKQQLPPVPPSFTIQRMNTVLMEKYQNELDPSYRKLWQSSQDFVEKGVGCSLLTDNQFASICNSYHIGLGYVDIDILTIDRFRGQGLATQTCALFIDHCLDNKLTPIWDCDAGNTASLHLAAKLGFKHRQDYPMLWWHENKDVIDQYLKEHHYTPNT